MNARILRAVEVSLGITTLLAILAFIFLTTSHEIRDPDIWLHLKTGELILQTKQIPKVDPFSFATAKKEWINHSWLAQIIFFKVFKTWGANGLIFLSAFLILATFLVLLFSFYRHYSNFTFILANIILSWLLRLQRIGFFYYISISILIGN